MAEDKVIQQLFKTEYRKLIAVLCKSFGIIHIEHAEDIVNDTFLLASEKWTKEGLPVNPAAWLYTVAKNKTKDHLKHDKIFNDKIVADLKQHGDFVENFEIDLSIGNIKDSQLAMIFAICNPIIPPESQIGLALRILCGFGIDEIADAFLTNKETINKRLFRAKEKLRTAKIKIELPLQFEINERLENVLTTLYLLYNEGYYSTTQNTILRKELCLEAMRLTYFLIENETTNKANVNALMALMCFHASRFDARTNELGEPVLYDNQDKNLWDEDLILKGNTFLIKSAAGEEVSKYHIEASIAFWHSTKLEHTNKWEHILQLYNQLLLIDYSPISALNRTYALSKTAGKAIAIAEAIKLNLHENHFYHSLLGYLYTDFDVKLAIYHYELALSLAKSKNDKNIIENRLKALR